MKMYIIVGFILLIGVICEPHDVIVQLLYKPKDCRDIGQHGDTMYVQYLGRFYDSKETFDSSYRRNNVPFNYKLGIGGVIEGYQIGTKDMCINERRRLIVPSKYAYGASGTGNIPGYSTLMFDVHLVQLNDSPPAYEVPIDLSTRPIVEGNQDCEHPIQTGDIVEIQYIGSLPDGKMFDNGTETPIKFVVGSGQIIAGIDEGIVSFCKGSLLKFEIPPAKAYKDRWDGPVPQWSFVYYNVTVVGHVVRELLPDGESDIKCEDLSTGPCSYKIQPGDYVNLSYKVLDSERVELGSGDVHYPVGRKLYVPGWDEVIVGSCVNQKRLCWIPSNKAHVLGTSLFLAVPEKGFYSELEVTEILLTVDEKDSIDLQDLEEINMSTQDERAEEDKKMGEDGKVEEDEKVEIDKMGEDEKVEEDKKVEEDENVEEDEKVEEDKMVEEDKKMGEDGKVEEDKKMGEDGKVEEDEKVEEDGKVEEDRKMEEDGKVEEALPHAEL